MPEPQSRFSEILDRFRPSTGLRLFLILLIALTPLALAAVLATVQITRNAEAARMQLLQDKLDESALGLNQAFEVDRLLLLRLGNRIAGGADAATLCDELRTYLSRERGPTGIVITRRGRTEPMCEIGPISAEGREVMTRDRSRPVQILPAERLLLFHQRAADLDTGIDFFYRDAALAQIVQPLIEVSSGEITLEGEFAAIDLTPAVRAGPLQEIEQYRSTLPVQGLGLSVKSVRGGPSTLEVLALYSPVLLILVAAVIAWMVVNRVFLQPVRHLRRKMTGYRAGDRINPSSTIARTAPEIEELDQVFAELAHQVADDRHALDQGLQHQVRLTREVHHRVKNNLQIIASLINLHARGAETPEAEQAYATIQRRVDALAVVHRNHYATGETNSGISLRALTVEILNGFKSYDADDGLSIDSEANFRDVKIQQDVAVPVAFLLTELFDLIQKSAEQPEVHIRLTEPAANGGDEAKVTLVISSEALGPEPNARLEELLLEGMDRVITGLSRQLRSPIDRDRERGSVSVTIGVLSPEAENGPRRADPLFDLPPAPAPPGTGKEPRSS